MKKTLITLSLLTIMTQTAVNASPQFRANKAYGGTTTVVPYGTSTIDLGSSKKTTGYRNIAVKRTNPEKTTAIFKRNSTEVGRVTMPSQEWYLIKNCPISYNELITIRIKNETPYVITPTGYFEVDHSGD